MASVLRTGLANFNSTGLLVGLCKVVSKRHNVALIQVARISGRDLRQDRPPRPPPYDYKNKKLGMWAYHTDPMLERFDDNTKVVVIEGMPTVGKDKFARKLAEELEMKYVPPPSYDDILINPYGYDLRKLNDKLPIDAQFYDLSTFLREPTNKNVTAMQCGMLWMRSAQYIDALAHVLSTGEGVVLQRTPWTDSVFMTAMANCGYVNKRCFGYHQCASKATVFEFMRPHLVLYLDAPLSVVKANIKKRNIPDEVNSPALTDKYLGELEKLYKDYLKEASLHGHLLIYDWSTEGDIGVVVEDIERLDFDIYKKGNLKFKDWHWDREMEIQARRYDFCMDKKALLQPMQIIDTNVPEMFRSGSDCEALENAVSEIATECYAPGFVPGVDKGIFWKLNDDRYVDWWPKEIKRKAK